MTKKRIFVRLDQQVTKTKTIVMNVETDSHKVYVNLLEFVGPLRSAWSSKFLLWLMERCDKDNIISIGQTTHIRFCDTIRAQGVIPPASRTMKDVMAELVRTRCLIRTRQGEFMINPMFYFKGKDLERTRAIATALSNGVDLRPMKVSENISEVLSPQESAVEGEEEAVIMDPIPVVIENISQVETPKLGQIQ